MDRWADNAKLSIHASIHMNEWAGQAQWETGRFITLFYSSERKQYKEDRKYNMQLFLFVSKMLFLWFTSCFFSLLHQIWERENKLKVDKGKIGDRDWLILIHSPIRWGQFRWSELGSPCCYSLWDRQKMSLKLLGWNFYKSYNWPKPAVIRDEVDKYSQ